VARPTLDAWRAALGRHDLRELADLFRRIADFDITGRLGRITAPTLIVTGDRDPYIRRRSADRLAETIPGARLTVLEHTGHMFFAENTGAYQRLLIDWLNSAAGYSLGAVPAVLAAI
jgi:pimeloyl-ACP methyl ester carboxylesterase